LFFMPLRRRWAPLTANVRPSQKCVLPAIRRLGLWCRGRVVPTSGVNVAARSRLRGVVTSGEFFEPRLARVCTGTVASVNQATAKVVQ